MTVASGGTPPPILTKASSSSRGLLMRVRRRVDWVAVAALGLLALFLQPALHAGFRADDTWNSVERGKLALSDQSLLSHIWTSAETFYRQGRPNFLGVSQGLFTVWLVDLNTVAYHALLVALTLVAAGLLYALVRELGLSRGGGLLVITVLAGAIQFRSYHDAMLGYSGTTQQVLILTLASLLAFIRGLRRDDRRLLALSFLLFLPCPLLYEGAYTLVLVHGGIALLERRGRAALRPSLPFLAIGAAFIALSLYTRATATVVPEGYEVGGGPLATLRTYVIQLFTPLPASNVFFRADFGSFLPIGGNPTPAELLAAGWRGAAVLLIVLVVTLSMAARSGWRLPAPRALRDMAVIGALLWLTPVIAVSAAPKYQLELVAGKGHLPALIQAFGWALVATAALLALVHAAAERSTAATRMVALGGSAVLAFAAGVVGFNNMRVVALETPIVETRALLERSAEHGAFATMPAGASLVFSPRDLDWPTGRWSQVPDGLESMLVDRSGRRFDGRILGPETALDCPSSGGFPPADCEPLRPAAAWVRVRARPGGGSVILSQLPAARRAVAARAVTEELRVFRVGDGDSVRPPRVVGLTPKGKPWASDGLPWRRVDRGDGWAIFLAEIRARPLPVASSLDDPDGRIDFTALGPPERIVRFYGTKRLLP